ncbi:hypothetical protein DMC47_39900 [Nostoc sp. 3335mG]|nr:hypothetical protein DMC47_39900 [Nostoc sp. 3335mG]
MKRFDPRSRAGFGAALALCIAWPSVASAGCGWLDVNGDDVQVAKVTPGKPRVYFVIDRIFKAQCPAAGAACQDKTYLVPGDVVVTGKREGAFVCAGFVNTRGSTTIGWFPAAALAPLPAAERQPNDWVGHWSAPEQDITIKAAGGGMLHVSGDATWGMGDKWRRENGAVHIGEVKGTARPVGGVIAFTEGDDKTLPYTAGDEDACSIRMVRRGPYLLARDNNQCGGLNVSFTGFYRRKP